MFRNHFATVIVVATLTVINCEQTGQILADPSKVEELCPCLPAHICPRVFGTKPDVSTTADLKCSIQIDSFP